MASRSDDSAATGVSERAARAALSRSLLTNSAWSRPSQLVVPSASRLDLPERAMQFGTGAFLRGFVEYFIDSANGKGLFNGRVVVIGSTGSGRDRAFTTQDGLFTLQSAGADSRDDELRIVASVSRALSAADQWNDVLSVARQPDIDVIFSNTTEAGLALSELDVSANGVPVSFPAKLARVLLERARAFDYEPTRGVVVIPCELIEDNGSILRSLVHSAAMRWEVEPQFFSWLDRAVPFCNTLVDRIVPGAPPAEARARLEDMLGYADELLTVAEPYRLFVIEANDEVRARLAYLAADKGVVMADNIRAYRERKVRLLNGTHTGLAAIGLLSGIATVDAAMRDEAVATFARELLHGAIAPMVDAPDANAFGEDVLKRFANPHVHHRLTDIATQATLKLRVRLLPIVQRYVAVAQAVPRALAVAAAAQLVLLHPQTDAHLSKAGFARPADELGARVRDHWNASSSTAAGVAQILADETIWLEDLTRKADFAELVGILATALLSNGAQALLQNEFRLESRVVVA